MKFCLFIFVTIFAVCFGKDVSLKDTLELMKSAIERKDCGAYLCFGTSDLRLAIGYEGSFSNQLLMKKLIGFEGDTVFKSHLLPFESKMGWAAPFLLEMKNSWDDQFFPLPKAFLSTHYKLHFLEFLSFLKKQNLVVVHDFGMSNALKYLFGKEATFVLSEEFFDFEKDDYSVIVWCSSTNEKVHASRVINRHFFIDLSQMGDAFTQWEITDWKKWIGYKNKIKVLYTSALIPFKFEERKNEYIRSLKILENFGYKDQIYVVESGPFTPLSFFEEFSSNVFYANVNDVSLKNKGVNEINASIAAFDFYDFDDEDMIVKIVGRYYFESDQFLKLIESTPDIDAFAAPRGNSSLEISGVSTGSFAMRAKYFKRMMKELNLEKMERNLIDLELEVYRFLQKMEKEGAKVLIVDRLDLTANVSNSYLVHW